MLSMQQRDSQNLCSHASTPVYVGKFEDCVIQAICKLACHCYDTDDDCLGAIS